MGHERKDGWPLSLRSLELCFWNSGGTESICHSRRWMRTLLLANPAPCMSPELKVIYLNILGISFVL